MVFLPYVQFMWRTAPSTPTDPPSGIILTDTGHILEGKLWSKLGPWEHAATGPRTTCAAMSSDGYLLALAGAGDEVTVLAFEQPGRSFSTAIASQVESLLTQRVLLA